MAKENLFKILEVKFKCKARLGDTYEHLQSIGIKCAFKHLSEKEKQIAATYVRAVPHAYYNRYAKEIYGSRLDHKIDNMTQEIRDLVWEYRKYFYPQYVGPFFVIDGKVKALRTNINDGDINGDFVNSPVSHFQFANFLHLEDYGHYPRGRVIYNNKTNEFYVYIDKSLLNNKEILEQVQTKFWLICFNTVVKSDEHYTHDDL